MNQASKITLSLFVFIGLVILFTIDFPIGEEQLIGVYVNNNHGEEPFYVEIPYQRDTLILRRNRTFTSDYYGDGTFKFNSGYFSNKLTISYGYSPVISEDIQAFADSKSRYDSMKKTSNASHVFSIKNRFLRPLRIELVKDLGYFYSKKKLKANFSRDN